MPIVTVNIGNETKTFSVVYGTRLMDLFIDHRIDTGGTCGGKGICNKCLVGIVGARNETLACHYYVTNDVTVSIKSRQSKPIYNSMPTVYESTVTEGFGVAIDLGTTTIAMYLYDLKTNMLKDSCSFLNPQAIYGADVISRIDKCLSGFLLAENEIVIQAINQQIIQWLSVFSITEISRIVIAGNPTMLHIIANVNPGTIGSAPYTPVFLETKTLMGKECGLLSEKIILLPSISAFIGADLSAGMISSGMLEAETSLLIDMGTNGEIILKKRDFYFGCSTATGPAFEGANIEKGLGGIKGAIARVTFNTGKLAFETIGNQPPIGICGSGLVDLVAILVSEGIIDETGAFCHNSQSQLANHLDADRFMLLNDIYLTQKDVRQFQLAKSAICAGIETLLNAANVDVDAVNKVFVAGGFGFYLNLDNALKIGLLPKVFHGRIISVGNTSGLGAAMCLLNPEKIKQVQELALKVQTIDLMTKEFGFTERFIENMMFSI
ncbi:MAG: ASKHA domain-containing protein [Candidatus Izemoplasmatales bacterium]|jgi:uncharacterized 2Fe-2S/4Fe-4S cluster protein (DUF4445 family)